MAAIVAAGERYGDPYGQVIAGLCAFRGWGLGHRPDYQLLFASGAGGLGLGAQQPEDLAVPSGPGRVRGVLHGARRADPSRGQRPAAAGLRHAEPACSACDEAAAEDVGRPSAVPGDAARRLVGAVRVVGAHHRPGHDGGHRSNPADAWASPADGWSPPARSSKTCWWGSRSSTPPQPYPGCARFSTANWTGRRSSSMHRPCRPRPGRGRRDPDVVVPRSRGRAPVRCGQTGRTPPMRRHQRAADGREQNQVSPAPSGRQVGCATDAATLRIPGARSTVSARRDAIRCC